MTVRYENRVKTYDTKLVLSYSHNYVTANLSGKNSTGTTGNYVDLGGEGYTEGKVVFDVTDISKPAAGILINMEVQGGKTTSFASHVPLATLPLAFAGLGSVRPYATLSNSAGNGRYIIPFCNQYGDELYRYVKVVMRSTVTASLSTGIEFSSFITK
jgi:hypothetical protein